jgi:transcription initiation factor TFIIH subunit 3
MRQSVFAVDAATRKFLRLPGTARVDFRASCFCHKRQIDLGWAALLCIRNSIARIHTPVPPAAIVRQ